MNQNPFMAAAKGTLIFLFSLFSNFTNGDEKKYVDPYITCPGNNVPDNAHGLPSGYDRDHYFNVMQLCSGLNGNSRNVGCVCANSNEHSFRCHPGIADPLLFHAVITHSLKPFPTFCADSCFCTDTESAALNRSGGYDRDYYTGEIHEDENNNYWDPNNADYNIHPTTDDSEGGYRQIPGNPTNGWEGEDALNSTDPVPTKVAVAHDQCWKNCTSNADCSAGGEKGCMCTTHKEQYQPGSGTVAFLAACIISISGAGGKREEMRPCPCNATYVSQACCAAADGLVWEEPHFKLGELEVDNES